jgi:[ribosomal protein S5]-alanine N-acetyltransferase
LTLRILTADFTDCADENKNPPAIFAAIPLKSSVAIRRPRAQDLAAFLAAVRRSHGLHHGWVSPPGTRKSYMAYVSRATSTASRGFLVIHRPTQALVGVINVSNIILGPFRSAFLGYYAFADFAGQGLMRQGMRLALAYAFNRLQLHRVEANIQPTNRASLALVRRCGFVREGYSKRYLKIAGRWRDHERWALLAEDFRVLT